MTQGIPLSNMRSPGIPCFDMFKEFLVWVDIDPKEFPDHDLSWGIPQVDIDPKEFPIDVSQGIPWSRYLKEFPGVSQIC